MTGPAELPAPLLNVAQVATMLGVGHRWVYRQVEKDPPKLPFVRIDGRHLRFELAAIEAYIAERREGGLDDA